MPDPIIKPDPNSRWYQIGYCRGYKARPGPRPTDPVNIAQYDLGYAAGERIRKGFTTEKKHFNADVVRMGKRAAV